MRVHLIKRRVIDNFIDRHATGRKSFEAWLKVVKNSEWTRPADIIETFNTADLLGNGSNRVVFNVGGNNYRLIGKYYFGDKNVHLFVKWIGTHAEYKEICKKSDQYVINHY